MRSLNIMALLAVSVGALATGNRTAFARQGGQPYNTDKSFGLGIMLGAPSGLTMKYFVRQQRAMAIDVGVGLYHEWRYDDALQVHADWLWHPLSLFDNADLKLPIYAGVGARFVDFETGPDDHGSSLGVRVPFGLSFDLQRIPIEVFLEFVLVVDLVTFDHDRDRADFNAALGARFYF